MCTELRLGKHVEGTTLEIWIQTGVQHMHYLQPRRWIVTN